MCLWSSRLAQLWHELGSLGKQILDSPVTYSGRDHTSKSILLIHLLSAMRNPVGRMRALEPPVNRWALARHLRPPKPLRHHLATAHIESLHALPFIASATDPSVLHSLIPDAHPHYPFSLRGPLLLTPASLPPFPTPPAASATTSVPWASTPYVTAVPRRPAPS